MASYLIGFLLALLVVAAPVFVMGGNTAIFVSAEALVIVCGGTVAVALASYPWSKVSHLVKVVIVVLRKEIDDGPTIVRECIELARDTRGDRPALRAQEQAVKFPFLRDGVGLILDKLDDDLETILGDRIRTKREEDDMIVNMLRRLATFPPALGLLATVLSLVHLLQGMGSGATGMAGLGPSMAVGLVGTLYGIVVANLMLAPMAENLSMKSALDLRNRQIAMMGLLLIAARKSPLSVQESLNSMLPVSKRINVLGTERMEEAG